MEEVKSPHVSLTGITKFFGKVRAVFNFSLQVRRGEILSLLGPSGCGKTTVLRLIAGLEEPDAGIIAIGDRIVAGGKWVSPEKRGIGMVFQDYALFPHMTVFENIAFGLRGYKRQELKQKVMESLSMVGLSDLMQRYPHELSSGQQQRVALARAIAPGPEVLLLDEPFSNLDTDLRTRIRVETKDILLRAGATVIFVTHDQEEAFFMGDRVGVMSAGQLEQVDIPEAIFYRPATPFIAQFVGIADFIPGEVQGKAVATELGLLPLYAELPRGAAVRVMVRPDTIDICPAPDGAGVIVERVFHGMHWLYWVRLPSGATVRSLQHHSQSYPVGAPVRVTVVPHRSMVCFLDGRAIGEVLTD
jgi:iron(III) transport system ATP-binding protein